jgi:hypothetical protein
LYSISPAFLVESEKAKELSLAPFSAGTTHSWAKDLKAKTVINNRNK